MRKRITQLKALSLAEWQLLLSSIALLPLIALALRRKGFRWTRGLLKKHIPGSENQTASAKIPPDQIEANLPTAQSVARVVTIAANYGPYRANCLKISLATWWLLQRRNIPVQLIIGADKDAEGFTAHAWVEYAGTILFEADDIKARYTPFGPP